ncbi:cytochrome P450 [Microbacterium rhizophilus]|uniref:cytochrome P450 n=1 Tax=Microbacterium rhizophilus TaxID=3138934 RepID=UPI0031E5D45E
MPVAMSAPTADWVSLEALTADPIRVFARLREEAPIAWVPTLGRYLVTTYAGCRAVESDGDVFGPARERSLMLRSIGPNMLTKGDPAHAVERAAVNPSLRPRAMHEIWGAIFARNAERALRHLIDAGPGADLAVHFAEPFAAANLAALVGLAHVDAALISEWSAAFIGAVGNHADDPDACERNRVANEQIGEHLDEAIDRVRRTPDPSMLSGLVNSPVPLPEDVIRANIKLAIAGGVNEPQHTMTNGVWALATHPEQRDAVLARPELWPAVFEEVVRWLSPIQSLTRQVFAPTRLEGVDLAAGDQVMAILASANRDPQHFDRPDVFDIHRERRPHLGFGAGIHLCAGSWSSRSAIAQFAWPLLYQRLEGLRPVDPSRAQWTGFGFRGLTELPVTWDHVKEGTDA